MIFKVFTVSVMFCLSMSFVQGQDTLMEKQDLYNGRVWINKYLMVKGDQFLFSRSFQPGSVTVRGKTYHVNLRYDIFEDQLQTIAGHFGVLQINKDLVDSFKIPIKNREFNFIPVMNDTSRLVSYYNILYAGNASLYVSYVKKINRQSSNSEGAAFYQINRLCIVKDGRFSFITKKADLFNAFMNEELSIRNYIKKNRLRVTIRDPQSLVPVISFYNSLISPK